MNDREKERFEKQREADEQQIRRIEREADHTRSREASEEEIVRIEQATEDD